MLPGVAPHLVALARVWTVKDAVRSSKKTDQVEKKRTYPVCGVGVVLPGVE
jgi:hypothetical protein